MPALLVGSYTASGGGNGTGLSLVQDGVVSTVAELDDPSFLAVSGDRVYAVSEVVDGGVRAFRRQGSTLSPLWQAPSGGDAPCHVRVDASGVLVVTNYTSGTVTAVPLAAAETLTASVAASDGVVVAAPGEGPGGAPGVGGVVVPEDVVDTAVLPDVTGPDLDQQEGPHAHQSIAAPEGTILVADLGGDALHEFAVVAGPDGGSAVDAFSLEPVRVHHVAPGAGPRHMAWHDGDLFVAGELDGRVYRLRRDGSGAFTELAVAPTWDGPAPDAPSYLSHIEVDEAGRVVVAVRGRDVIAVLDAADGGLSFVGAVPCGGSWPRHFARVPGYLLVANERSDAIAVLPVGQDGMPGSPVGQIAVGTPTCIVAV